MFRIERSSTLVETVKTLRIEMTGPFQKIALREKNLTKITELKRSALSEE
jgi:hypothetical protein